MAELSGNVIVTNYGEQQLLAGTFEVTKIKLGSGIWTPTQTSTVLQTQVASVPASGSVDSEGAGGYRLTVSGVDDSASSYDLHEFALTDDTDVALAIYSQPTVIVSKGAGADLLFGIDFVIENAPAASITINGDTTYQLPIADTAGKGIIEIATQAEANALADTTRAVTPGTIPIATLSQRGLVELATGAEVDLGLDALRAVSPNSMKQSGLVPTALGQVETGPTPEVKYAKGIAPSSLTYFGNLLDIGFPSSVADSPALCCIQIMIERTGGGVKAQGVLTNGFNLRIEALRPDNPPDLSDFEVDLETTTCRIHYTVYGN